MAAPIGSGKGPVGALYGNAYGGALIASSLAPSSVLQNTTRGYTIVRSPGEGAAGGWSEEAGFAHTQRLNQTKSSILHLQLFWNDTPGFREQEYNRRNQAEMQLLRTEKVGRTATHLDRLDGGRMGTARWIE